MCCNVELPSQVSLQVHSAQEFTYQANLFREGPLTCVLRDALHSQRLQLQVQF